MSISKYFLNVNNISLCKATRNLLFIYAIQSVCGGIGFYMTLFLNQNTTLDILHIGILVSGISMGNIFGSNLGGYVSDKHNPSYAMKLGLIIQGLSLFFLIFVTNFYAILLIMVFMGSGSYYYVTSTNYVLNLKFDEPETRAQIISTQHIISNVGMFFAAILMGYCAAGYYFSIFFTVSLCLVFIGSMLKPLDKEFYTQPVVDRSVENQSQSTTKLYLVGLLGVTLIGVIYSQHRVGYPLFLESYFGTVNTGYLMSLNPLIILLFQSSIIKKFSKLNELFSLGLGLLLFGLSFFLLNCSTNLQIIFLSCIIMTLGEILGLTYAQSIAFGYAPQSMKGRILGLYKSIFSVTKLMGVYAGSLMINYTNYTIVWTFCGCLGVLGFVVTLFIFMNSKQRFVKKYLNDFSLSEDNL